MKKHLIEFSKIPDKNLKQSINKMKLFVINALYQK